LFNGQKRPVRAGSRTGGVPVADIHTHFVGTGTQWLGNQIIALGMLYYRMKDMF
jgi:hypothetical protein